MDWEGRERRKAPRAKFSCKIIVSYPEHELTTTTENISSHGARFILEEELVVYDIIGLKFFFEKNRSVLCEARVRWVIKKINEESDISARFDTGVEFIFISETDRKYIKELVESILKSGGDEA